MQIGSTNGIEFERLFPKGKTFLVNQSFILELSKDYNNRRGEIKKIINNLPKVDINKNWLKAISQIYLKMEEMFAEFNAVHCDYDKAFVQDLSNEKQLNSSELQIIKSIKELPENFARKMTINLATKFPINFLRIDEIAKKGENCFYFLSLRWTHDILFELEMVESTINYAIYYIKSNFSRTNAFTKGTMQLKLAIQEYKAAAKFETKKEKLQYLIEVFPKVIPTNWQALDFHRTQCELKLDYVKDQIEKFQNWLATLLIIDSFDLIPNTTKLLKSLEDKLNDLVESFNSDRIDELAAKLFRLFKFAQNSLYLVLVRLQMNLSLKFIDEMIVFLQTNQNAKQYGNHDKFFDVLNGYKKLYPAIRVKWISINANFDYRNYFTKDRIKKIDKMSNETYQSLINAVDDALKSLNFKVELLERMDMAAYEYNKEIETSIENRMTLYLIKLRYLQIEPIEQIDLDAIADLKQTVEINYNRTIEKIQNNTDDTLRVIDVFLASLDESPFDKISTLPLKLSEDIDKNRIFIERIMIPWRKHF